MNVSSQFFFDRLPQMFSSACDRHTEQGTKIATRSSVKICAFFLRIITSSEAPSISASELQFMAAQMRNCTMNLLLGLTLLVAPTAVS